MPSKSKCDQQNMPQTYVLSFTGVVESFCLKLGKERKKPFGTKSATSEIMLRID